MKITKSPRTPYGSILIDRDSVERTVLENCYNHVQILVRQKAQINGRILNTAINEIRMSVYFGRISNGLVNNHDNNIIDTNP